jgi:hypothetical protein
MEHADFPIDSFGFMNDPATNEQKEMIVELCEARDTPIDPNGKWPEPFTKWDAKRMIDNLEGES